MKIQFYGDRKLFEALEASLKSELSQVNFVYSSEGKEPALEEGDVLVLDCAYYKRVLDSGLHHASKVFVIGPYLDHYDMSAFSNEGRWLYLPLSQLESRLLPALKRFFDQH
ncbi:hypothetical protein JCM19231_119 [Vibrio ishigakensis]|uniref:Uncharacterized protein n=1 Tax=Vibrio ishigakensis TaxID=1481914 RepID=A0A0B8NZS8_9VIBR|nr:hypothetical protein [Vibrio ishigakensis]GAM59446.1 hypothetical protein JCM19231_119 [Vibrio ishigakensis]